MACAHGNSFVVHTLLRGGAVRIEFGFSRNQLIIIIVIRKDVNIQDGNGWTPIFTATYHGRLGCLQMLIKWGSKTDETDNEGNTLGSFNYTIMFDE